MDQMVETQHRWTGLLLVIFAILIILGAVFLTVSFGRIYTIPEYKAGNSKLNNARSSLLVAFILGYIAAGIAVILAILYFGHVAWGINSELPHLFVFILLFACIIISGIFGFVALSNISNSGAQNKAGSEGWIWAALIAYLVGLIVLIISGAWRASYVSRKKTVTKRTGTEELTFTNKVDQHTMEPSYAAPMIAPSTASPSFASYVPSYAPVGSSYMNNVASPQQAITTTYIPPRVQTSTEPVMTSPVTTSRVTTQYEPQMSYAGDEEEFQNV
jgi:hypothetical protein